MLGINSKYNSLYAIEWGCVMALFIVFYGPFQKLHSHMYNYFMDPFKRSNVICVTILWTPSNPQTLQRHMSEYFMDPFKRSNVICVNILLTYKNADILPACVRCIVVTIFAEIFN